MKHSPTSRRSRAERRQQIGEAALRIIGTHGLSSFTVAAIAEEIGVTSGALFRHFASRDEILEEAVRSALAQAETTFPDPGLPPLERLSMLASNRFALLEASPGIAWLLRSDQAFLVLPEASVEALSSLVSRSHRYLLDAIRDGIEEGSIRGDVEPELLVVVVVGTIHALIRYPGGRRLATSEPTLEPQRVLAGLERLLRPSPEQRTTP